LARLVKSASGIQDNARSVSEKATPTSSAYSLPMLKPGFKYLLSSFLSFFFFSSLKIYAHSQMPNKEYFSSKNVILSLTLLHA